MDKNISNELNRVGMDVVNALDALHIKLAELQRLEELAPTSSGLEGAIRLPVVEIEQHVDQALQRCYEGNPGRLEKFGHDRSAEFAGIKKIVR